MSVLLEKAIKMSISEALPALAATLNDNRFTNEPLLRRAINAALRVGTDKELDILIAFSRRNDIKDNMQAEALATLGSWATPSVLDRVDGRFRGKVERDPSVIKAKMQPFVASFLKETNPETLVAVAGLLANLNMMESNNTLANIFANTKESKVKMAILPALNQLKYAKIESLIKTGMADKDENVRTVALGLLNNETVSKESLATIADLIFTKGTVKEQQKLLTVMAVLDKEKTMTILDELIDKMKDKKLSDNINLELEEAVAATGSETLKTKLASINTGKSMLDAYKEALYGGNRMEGRNIFNYNSTAQCVRCHTVGADGGNVGPALMHIANTLTREQILEALVDPSARIAPGFGSVSLKLKGGQEVIGVLIKEADGELTLKTSEAEPLVIPIARIEKRQNLPSSMPPMGELLSKREIRDIVEFLGGLK